MHASNLISHRMFVESLSTKPAPEARPKPQPPRLLENGGGKNAKSAKRLLELTALPWRDMKLSQW